ncbi:hypothetical protein A4R35_10020 [Thermogemmatispora tikiterensis]|uniref:Uncharacterized protein n=1 Tax=Thermogemmatispora tikiterensis TaxID=1825093 RepID=A0A328VJT2_9CHLR|nr:hypothetical protein A4R35_10020 [Thermogemmatispora tikiterensis]
MDFLAEMMALFLSSMPLSEPSAPRPGQAAVQSSELKRERKGVAPAFVVHLCLQIGGRDTLLEDEGRERVPRTAHCSRITPIAGTDRARARRGGRQQGSLPSRLGVRLSTAASRGATLQA